ncbi:MAG: hypothetical protein J6T74_04275 [Clostridia bacterium]|nr:hypothetical protein [Clostridia bacterium]
MMLSVFDFFDGDWFNNWFVDKILEILSLIPKFLYFFVACLLSIGDFFQVAFRKLAGLDPIIISGEQTTEDSLFSIITDAVVGNGSGHFSALGIAFWSFVILGLMLLIIFTIVAVIRVEYMPDKEKGNSKSNIIKNFFIAIANIAIIPVACLFGLFLGNQMLVVLDDVTASISSSQTDAYQYFDKWTSSSTKILVKENIETYYAYEIFGEIIPTTSEPFSGMVFKASAYSANRFRKYGSDYLSQIKATGTNLGFLNDGSINEPEIAATVIDIGFGVNAKLKNAPPNGYSLSNSPEISRDYYRSGWLPALTIGKDSGIKNFSKYNVKMVWYFYDLWTFNYIVSFVAMVAIARLYYNFCLALMARAFEGFALFIIAPVAASIMPLDNGSLGRWRKQFIGKYLVILGMVFGMNIISPLLQIFQQFKFFNLAILDYLVYTLFIIAGLNAANSIAKAAMNVLTEKGGDVYEGSLKAASDIDKYARSGIGMTARAAGMIGGAGLTGIGLASHGVGKTIEWGRRGALRTQQRNAIGDTRMDANRRSSMSQELRGMNRGQRDQLATNMFATEQGQEFIRNNFGGDENAARRAIVEGNYRGANGQFQSTFENDDMLNYMHERDLFNRSSYAEGLTEGSADYSTAFNRFRTAGTYANGDPRYEAGLRYRQNGLMNRAPINQQQAQIQQRRQQVINHEPTNRFTRGLSNARNATARAFGRFSDSRTGRLLRRTTGNFTNVMSGILRSTLPFFGQNNRG